MIVSDPYQDVTYLGDDIEILKPRGFLLCSEWIAIRGFIDELFPGLTVEYFVSRSIQHRKLVWTAGRSVREATM
jgi:hypothetical protein